MQTNQFFITARPSRLFFTVAIPGMISMLAMSIYGVIEGIFIGNLLGEAAFAAINIAMPFVMINFSLADMMGVGSSVPISIFLGRKENDKANNYFTCSLILILSAAAFMGVILYYLSPLFVSLMGAEGELLTLSVKYVRVYSVLGPVTTLIFAMDNYLRICGFVKFSMILNIFMSLLTVLLLYIFVGIMGMNVDGAALATSLAMSFCAMIALIPFILKKTVLKFVKPKFSFEMIKKVVFCGTPTFLNNIAGRVASIIMNTAILRVGGQTAVAVYSVLMYAGETIQPLIYGITDSVQPAVGYNWGARKTDRVKSITVCSFIACAVVSIIGAAAMLLFPQQISLVFMSSGDNEFLSLCAHAMRLFSIAYIFRWVSFSVQGFLSAIEKPMPASVLSLTSAMVFPILFIVVLAPLGLDGLWLNMTATSVVVAVIAAIMLLKVRKEII